MNPSTTRTPQEENALQIELGRLRGVESLHHKDRIKVLALEKECAKLRIEVTRWREAYRAYCNEPYKEFSHHEHRITH